jgi:uncharacterized membrane protein YhaH (DUF805 family)
MTKMGMMRQENVVTASKWQTRKDGNDTSFQVFMAGIAQMIVFCVITPCSSHPNKYGHSKPAGSIFFPTVRTNVLSCN